MSNNWDRLNGVETAPLLPTAEQTSIARFNALADQIRELHGLMLTRDGLFSYRQRIEDTLVRLERRFEAMESLVITELIAIKRAVAKKKAAPLVGKKGTGRKG